LIEDQIRDGASKANSRIDLNVGGKRFCTSKEVLLKQKYTYFSGLLDGHWETDEDGSFFIDRSPKHFGIILEYMRSGKLMISNLNDEQVDSLRSELDYYQIQIPESSFCIMKRASFGPEHIIEGWLRGKRIGQLLYKATKHGFSGDAFHQHCDNRGPTLVLIQSSEGWLFGGYAPVAWQSSDNYLPSSDAFLFTLTNPNETSPTKFNIFFQEKAQYDHKGVGPAFGDARKPDLLICSNSNRIGKSNINFPGCFVDLMGWANNTFTGTSTFQTKEIEVYEVVAPKLPV